MLNQSLYWTIQNFFENKSWYNKNYHYFLYGKSSTQENFIIFKINSFCKSNNIERANYEDLKKYRNFILEFMIPILDNYDNEIDHIIIEGGTENFDVKWNFCSSKKTKKIESKNQNEDWKNWVLYSEQLTQY